MLKTTNTEERSVHTNSDSCNIQLGTLKNQFNSKNIITPSDKKKRRLKYNVYEASKKYFEISTLYECVEKNDDYRL